MPKQASASITSEGNVSLPDPSIVGAIVKQHQERMAGLKPQVVCPPWVDECTGKVKPLAMIAMRLFGLTHSRFEVLPFEFIEVHLSKEKAFIFIIHDGKAITLEDDLGIFPSDALIASLRLLKG